MVLIISTIQASAQYGNNWYFYTKNAVRFDAFPPTLLSDCQMNLPQNASTGLTDCSTMSDVNGKLLFYSNGDSVYNKNHVTMPNGFDLCTSGSIGHVSLAIPFLNDTSRYYIFQTSKFIFSSPTNFYNYHIVNMSLNGGLGDVEVKNDTIYTESSERLTATKKANGLDYWLITHTQFGNTWKVFTINCLGFNKNNFIASDVGTTYNFNTIDYTDGENTLKISSNGKYLATNFTTKGYIELSQFNNATGSVSNPIKIKGRFLLPRSFEFSPNSKYIYIFSDDLFGANSGLDQYDISSYDSATISNSRIPILQSPPSINTYSQLQLAIDGRIYQGNLVPPNVPPSLSVIANPNVQGVGCNFIPNIVTLSGFGYVNALPYTIPAFSTSPNVQVSYTVAPDCRTVTFTGKTFIKGNNLTFKWKWGEPPPVGGTIADSATQVVASQGDTTFTTITHTYPLGVDTFFVNLSVTSDTVCGTGRAGIKVIVKPPKPKANFGFATTCNNLNVIITDSSLLNTNPSITHQYAVKPALAAATAYTNYSTQPNNNFTFATYDSFDIRLVVKSNLSCVTNDTIVKRIVLKAKPVAGFGYTNNCGSLLVNITSAASIAAGTITTQEYYVGNTLTSTGASPAYTFASYGSYTVKHVTKSNFGCISDTAFVPVIVKDKPTLSLSVIRDSVCLASSFTITANATVTASTIITYTWLKDGILLANNTNNLTQSNATGIYVYKVIATAANTCKSDTATKIITVVSKPTAAFTATNNCGSKAINILSSSNVINDNITGYYVNYGDNNTSTTNPNNTTYTYANYGSYTLKFVAKSSIGCASDTVFQTIVVKDKPTLTLFTARDSVCNNSSFTITANSTVASSTITNYTWLKDGILLANNTNNLTQNNATGIYVYKVIATAANTCKSDTVTKIITVVSKPAATLTATNVCGSKAINILSSANVINDNITGYYINYGDNNTSTINPNSTTYSYANYGSYNLKFVAKSSIGCISDTVFTNIIVKDKPTLSITYNNNACDTTNFTLSATANVVASTISNYTWLRNGTVLPITTNQLTDNQSTNNYTYKVVATANTGCISDTAFQNVTVQKYPKTIFTASNGCVNNAITITNNSVSNNAIGSLQYAWTTSSGQTSSLQLPSFSFSTSGIKNIYLKTTTSNGCADSLLKTITVEDFPVADFSITEACLGKKLTIVNNSTGAISSWQWAVSDGQVSNEQLPNFIFNTIGNYNIKLQVATANNCSNDVTKTTSIQAVQLFTTPAKDTNAVVNQPVVISVIGADTYAWSPMNNLQFTLSDNSKGFVASTAGTYPIQIEGTTAQGCKGTTSIKINVFVASNYVWIPNAFTPNADNLNDRVKITCSGLQTLTNFIIYNRYGETVYTQNTCNAKGWDGSYKGKEQPIGAYVYYWTGVDFKGKVVSGKGTVMLVR